MRRVFQLLTFLLLVTVALPNWAGRPIIVFGCSVDSNWPQYKLAEDAYRKAFDKLGYDFKMISYETHRRSLAESESGHIDGDCGRVSYLASEVLDTRLMRVNVLILTAELAVWSFTDKISITKANQINEKGLTLGYVRGAFVQEKLIRENKIERVVAANTYEQATKMLAAQRFDVFVAPPQIVNFERNRLHIESGLFKIGVLGSFQLYPYLNEKHKDLISSLELELQKIVPAGGV